MNWVKTNRIIKLLFPNYIWHISTSKKKVYLTFDDGPIPDLTEWVLDILKKENSKATFFCIGDNIKKHPEIFKRIISEGHSIGNHTFNHLNGWKTKTENYFENFNLCETEILNFKNLKIETQKSKLFRPPYGKIKPQQAKMIRKKGYEIIMWDVLSYDFDSLTNPEKCLKNVVENATNGSIIVFHDSIKAEINLRYTLPKAIQILKRKGFSFAKID